jgi:hypothetical protein
MKIWKTVKYVGRGTVTVLKSIIPAAKVATIFIPGIVDDLAVEGAEKLLDLVKTTKEKNKKDAHCSCKK